MVLALPFLAAAVFSGGFLGRLKSMRRMGHEMIPVRPLLNVSVVTLEVTNLLRIARV